MYAINASKWEMIYCGWGYEEMAEEVVAGEREKRTERATFPGMWVSLISTLGENNDPRERSRICRPGSDWNARSRVWPAQLFLDLISSFPLPLPVLLTRALSHPSLPLYLTPDPSPSCSHPPSPLLFPPNPVSLLSPPDSPFPSSPYVPYCHLGRPSPQEQGAAKISRTMWSEHVPAKGRIGEKEGPGGHSSLSRRPWLRACHPTQQHVPV